MLFGSVKSLFYSTLRLTLFIILFIDITNIRLQTSNSTGISKIHKRELEYLEMFQMPTEEEQKARVAEWEAKLVGKRLEDDVTDKQQDTPAQAASSDDAAEKKDDTEDSNKEKQQESSVVEVVKLSGLPQPVRVIKPGSRVTRDLRPNRMNVVCDENGLILKIGFY